MINPSLTMYYFEPNGYIPNHPSLPALHYKQAVDSKEKDLESIFQKNGWTNTWRGGIYAFHHYHSNTHEVLGVGNGSGLLMIGGEGGSKILVNTGDVLILPAGTGHKSISVSPDFEVVGAYPNGVDYNMKKDAKEDSEEVEEDILHVVFPELDPIYGKDGPLFKLWKR